MDNQIISFVKVCFFILFLGSCRHEKVSEMETENVKKLNITGEWIWTESTGGFGGKTLTPETEMLTKSLKIDDRTYKEFINGTLIYEIDYTLGLSSEPLFGTEEKTFIDFNSTNRFPIIIRENQIEIIEPCVDCYVHKYIRQ